MSSPVVRGEWGLKTVAELSETELLAVFMFLLPSLDAELMAAAAPAGEDFSVAGLFEGPDDEVPAMRARLESYARAWEATREGWCTLGWYPPELDTAAEHAARTVSK